MTTDEQDGGAPRLPPSRSSVAGRGGRHQRVHQRTPTGAEIAKVLGPCGPTSPTARAEPGDRRRDDDGIRRSGSSLAGPSCRSTTMVAVRVGTVGCDRPRPRCARGAGRGRRAPPTAWTDRPGGTWAARRCARPRQPVHRSRRKWSRPCARAPGRQAQRPRRRTDGGTPLDRGPRRWSPVARPRPGRSRSGRARSRSPGIARATRSRAARRPPGQTPRTANGQAPTRRWPPRSRRLSRPERCAARRVTYRELFGMYVP